MTINNSIIAIAVGLISWTQLTATESCRVVTVNESANIWEEGLGTYGDPEVDSDSQTVVLDATGNRVNEIAVGQMSWMADDAVLRKSTVQGKATWEAQPEGTDQKIRVIVYSSMRGIVLLADGNSSFARVATIDCSSLQTLENAALVHDNVIRLSQVERRALPAAVRAEMSKTDIPFELGDGYYDLKWSRLYRVVEQDGSTAGYMEEAHLTYTEGDDVDVIVRYDRNGLRHGDIE